MRRVILDLTFNGKNYFGWQVQSDAKTVQAAVQAAVESVLCTPTDIHGCSRTDSGVHANQYICHLDISTDMSNFKFVGAVNHYLPHDIAVNHCTTVSDDFHCRYDCLAKEYIYKIHNFTSRNPFYRHTALQFYKPLSAEKMNSTAQQFIGTHNFTAFTNSRDIINDNIRTITHCDVTQSGRIITIRVRADGFLYNMVRIMVNTIIYVSRGENTHSVAEIINCKDKTLASGKAPSHGLYLHQVIYPESEVNL